MKKTLKLLLSATMLAALLAGMQITAFAAVVSVANEDNVTSVAPGTARAATGAGDASIPGETGRTANETNGTGDETGRQNETATNDINPIAANPRTGAENLAIPAVVALLAASTAAIALTAKKRS